MMLDLESILKEWQEDCQIPQHQLDETQRLTPNLHAKYLQYLSLTKLNLKRAEHAQHDLLKDKWHYYQGSMDQDSIRERGWNPDPFDGLRVLKGDMDRYYNADKDIQKSEEKIAYLKTIIDTLEEIIQTLRWRHATIKNIMDYRKFESGA
jgi:hypothetical protein